MHSLQQVADELRNLDKVAIVSHVAPDGDCIGSMLALGSALRSIGLQVVLVNSDQLPDYLRFLPMAEQVVQPAAVKNWPDTLVSVDCSDLGRFGEAMLPFLPGKRVINIDHHISNTCYGQVNYVDSAAAATGQIIARLLDVLGIELDKSTASAIYAAVVTDTGSFQYSNTDSATHLLAARLINAGIDVAEINRKLYDTKELAAVKLLGKAMDSLVVSEDGSMAWTVISRAVLDELGAKDEHTEGVIGFTRALKSVEIGMLFREVSPDKIKVSFRSKEYADVNKLAGMFGGGGHVRASGCAINAPLEEAVAMVVSKAKEFVRNRDERSN